MKWWNIIKNESYNGDLTYVLYINGYIYTEKNCIKKSETVPILDGMVSKQRKKQENNRKIYNIKITKMI